MLMSARGAVRLAASVSLIALLGACSMTPEPLTSDQLAQQAKSDREEMFKGGEPLIQPLTMSDAIARALKYNLDRRSKVMEQALAFDQLDLDRWDLLPKLTANAGYTTRSEPYATTSRDLITQTTGADVHPTYSSDRDIITSDLSLSWNVLDFGLSYFTAKQNADRALIAQERKRKTVQNLVQEVRFAYWRAAAHQELQTSVDQAVANARLALERAHTVEQENLRAPVEALRYQKSLLEALRQLTAIQQELSTAEIELAALINLPPGTKLVLSVPKTMQVPQWNVPLDRMEELAFQDNPDLHEQGYLDRIAVNDTRKAITRLFPGISLSTGRQYDSNSFLVDNRWYDASAKLSWNLLSLASAPDQINHAEANEEMVKSRRLAMRMAVLAQVHLSERQFTNAVSQFKQSDELWRVDQRLYELSSAKSANDAQGLLEQVASQAGAIASQLRRFQTYAQVEQAYGKMQASIGQDLMPDTIAARDLPALSTVISQRLKDWESQGASGDIPVAAAKPVEEQQTAAPAPQAAANTSTDPDAGQISLKSLLGSAPAFALVQIGTPVAQANTTPANP